MRNTASEIIFLQETHIDNDDVLEGWKIEWGGEIISSHGQSNARGTAILFHPKLNFAILDKTIDSEGRMVCLRVKLQEPDKIVIVCNVYAPNKDEPLFFEHLICAMDSTFQKDHDDIILGGDFNLVINTEMDRNNSDYSNHHSLEILKEFNDHCNLVDVWRIQHEEEKLFTWHKWSRVTSPFAHVLI